MSTDGLRLAVGTLSVVRVAAPRHLAPGTFRATALLAPLAVLPLGLGVTGLGLLGSRLDAPATVVALLALALLALGTRVLHLDGLSDTADGLTASYDAARSLEVMRGGTAGPAGVVAVVLVLGLQAAALAALLPTTVGAVHAGLAVCASRGAIALCAVPALPAARPGGLGAGFAGVVPVPVAVGMWAVLAGILAAPGALADGSWWPGPVAAVGAVGVVVVLLARVRRRLGGITGDVLGAAIELALTALLVGLAVAAS